LKHNSFKRKLSFSLLSRFIVAYIVYVVFILVSAVLGYLVCSQFTWYYSPLYRILSIIANNIVFVIFFLCVLGFIVIFLWYWVKTLGYLQNVIDATRKIYETKDELITLPDELKDVENQMNQIKLNAMNSERVAKEAEQRKNDLVVYLAHDLKTPLTSVIGYLNLLQDEKQISEELREKYLGISLEKAERLEDLINEFFDITRFNLSNLTLDISKVNITRMLEQIAYEFKPMFDEKNLICELKTDPELYVSCDVNKMQRVFDNLIRNAINYSFENSKVELSLFQKDRNVHIIFLNYGNTIPREKLNRVFEQFYRLDSARTSKTGGAGLGLAIAKQIVELHHGSITASSENEVIIFEICIPI
jgi:two-component system sensor histidine kinase VanS